MGMYHGYTSSSSSFDVFKRRLEEFLGEEAFGPGLAGFYSISPSPPAQGSAQAPGLCGLRSQCPGREEGKICQDNGLRQHGSTRESH
jgi:hypothetical protein